MPSDASPRPGHSHLYTVNRAWLPTDSGNIRRGKRSTTTPPAPAESAEHPGNICRAPGRISAAPRQNLPPDDQRTTPKRQKQGQTGSRRLRRRKNRCLGPPRKRARNRPRKNPQRPWQKRQHPRRLVPVTILPLRAASTWRLWPRASAMSIQLRRPPGPRRGSPGRRTRHQV